MTEVINIFGDADPEEMRCVQAVCAKAKQLADLIEKHCPDCYERDQAVIRLKEALMWANAAIIE
jgi:hypothetical protein